MMHHRSMHRERVSFEVSDVMFRTSALASDGRFLARRLRHPLGREPLYQADRDKLSSHVPTSHLRYPSPLLLAESGDVGCLVC